MFQDREAGLMCLTCRGMQYDLSSDDWDAISFPDDEPNRETNDEQR